MLFHSVEFLWFLAAFVLLFGLLRKRLTGRNWLIVASSYFFYGYWDWRFLGLLLGSSLVDFFVGQRMEQSDRQGQRKLLYLSLGTNLGVLGLFKYFGFFIDSFNALLSTVGVNTSLPIIQVVLPVGISFYTFQSMSYTLDIYRGKLKPTRDPAAFLAYVAFFPQLVAGPIERATNLLPQFLSTRTLTYHKTEKGLWLIVWGLFKKVVIANNLAPLVDMVYGHDSASGLIIILATLAFALQIYCDFSGYSDIARGLAFLFGFDLMRNFNLPYFAISPQDFWRRWHISLSSWFRDYVYIPLGGNRDGFWRMKRNLFLTMLIAGLWHGAGWNFVLWGAWHGFFLMLFSSFERKRRIPPLGGWLLTMLIVGYGWLLFRAESFSHIEQLTRALFSTNLPPWLGSYLVCLGFFTTPLMLMQLWQLRAQDHEPILRSSPLIKGFMHGVLLYAIILFWETEETPFIYFQF